MEEEMSFEDSGRGQHGANPGPYDMLDQRAASMLSFPHMLNFGSCRRSLGWPFQRSVRLMLLPPLPYPIAGFTYCSTPLTPADRGESDNAAATEESLPPNHSFLLSGEVSSEGTAEAMYIHKVGKQWSFKNLVVSSLTPSVPIWLSSIIYTGSATTSRLTYTTDKHIFLLNNLTAITSNWAVGAELLYSVVEAKPSLSVGVRYLKQEGSTRDATTEFTLAAGVMGHIRATYAREVAPSVHLAARYEVNTNDMHSRTAGGLELRPSRAFPYILKAKYDTEDGVGLAIGHKLIQQRGAWMFAVNYDRRSGPHIGLSFHF
jgi:hypothetical protein